MNGRAIIFDLDDTLYRERRYALSGFAAVARWVSVTFALSAPAVFAELVASLKRGERARAFQNMCGRFGLDEACVPACLGVVRRHQPRLRLSSGVRSALLSIRSAGPTAILTNGRPGVQARKVTALGVSSLVDAVLFASFYGTGAGKPDPAAFQAVCARLGVAPSACVFVGNDPVADIAGARALGMATVRVGADAPADGAADADLVLGSVTDLPLALPLALGLRGARYVA